MMAELLAVLAGHPSSLFVSSSSSSSISAPPLSSDGRGPALRVREDLPHLHPAEVQILNQLATYSTRYVRIRSFAQAELEQARKRAIRAAVKANSLSSSSAASSRSRAGTSEATEEETTTTHMIPLCSTLLTLLRDYHALVLKTERDILADDAELVADRGFVSLANIRARLQEWDAPLSALDQLVNVLVAGPFGNKRPGFAPETAAEAAAAPLRASSAWTGGLLIDLLSHKADTGVKRVARCMAALRDAVEDSWMVGLVAWVCYGRANPEGGITTATIASSRHNGRGRPTKDQLVQWSEGSIQAGLHEDAAIEDQAITEEWGFTTSTWRFKTDALPKSISEATADSILYVGRALNTVKSSTAPSNRNGAATSTSASDGGSSGSLSPPEAMTKQHVALLRLRRCRPSQASSLDRAIQDIRNDVSEWLFRNVLTTEVVLESLETLGNYFLQREGNFTLSLLAELETMRKHKLFHTRSAAAGVIRATDMELALHRASVGTSAEDDPSLEKLRFVLPKGNFRPLPPSREAKASASVSGPSGKADSRLPAPSATPARFDDLIIGVPAQLHYTATFPLDLFLSPTDLTAYSRLFSYLFALKKTQSRVLGCWMSLSKSQRVRRRFTGTGEGGVDKSEERLRTELLRRSWGLTRNMLWFLDTLLGHFQTDIIDVQYTRLLSQLTAGYHYRSDGGQQHQAGSTAPLPKRGSRGSLRRSAVSLSSDRDRKDSAKSASSLSHARTHTQPSASELSEQATVPSSSASTAYAASTVGTHTPRASSFSSTGRGSGAAPTTFAHGSTKRVPFPSFGHHPAAPPSTHGGGGVAPPHYRPHLRSAGATSSAAAAAAAATAATAAFGGPGHAHTTSRDGASEMLEPGSSGPGHSTLDFTSLRLTHTFFLTFLSDGLLLTSPSASTLIRSILETCDRFAGLVERWGGDVLPSLLSEGGLSLSIDRRDRASNLESVVSSRQREVEDLETTLRARMRALFALLSSASASSGTGQDATQGDGAAQAGDESLVRPRTLPAPLLAGRTKGDKTAAHGRKDAKDGITDARVEADVAARRHLEQLLLRLDFGGRFEALVAKGKGEEVE